MGICRAKGCKNKTVKSTYCSKRCKCRDKVRKSQWEDPKRWILTRLKRRAKIKGLEFRLTLADIPDAPEVCPIFKWIKLKRATRRGKGFHPDAPTIDRKDHDKGYIPGNIRIISWWANTMRSNGGAREFEALLKDAHNLENERQGN